MRVSGNFIHRALFPSFLYSTSLPGVHLTFDDGPHPASTNIILDVLKSRQAKGTFFLLGNNVDAYPDIARRIVSEGHAIGNHSFDHPFMVLRSKKFVVQQVSGTENSIVAATSRRPRLFRPPYGLLDQWTAKIVRQLGYEIVMWTTDPADFQPVAAEVIVSRATRDPAPGSIILLHDNGATANRIGEILEKLISRLSKLGFTFSGLPS
ncbi:MAG: polysaccharide deacetylase family protein [Ignavibacteriales bacterium]|nr:polysaccharide deacetylase family protein [Ignavibacteriales bacterium]